MPKRIQRKRTAGSKMPQGARYVGRGTKYGNPWSTKQGYTLEECVARFETYLIVRRNPPTGWTDIIGYPSDEEIRRELGGRNLACWCKIPADGEPDRCHAAPLMAIANEERQAT